MAPVPDSFGTPAFSPAVILDGLPSGALVTDIGGEVLQTNRAAHRLLGPALTPGVTCCALFGCGRPGTRLEGTCLTAGAIAGEEPLPEVRLDVAAEAGLERRVWVVAVGLGQRAAVIQVRPATAEPGNDGTVQRRPDEPTLLVRTLGRTELYRDDTPVGGPWLGHRPGQLLKFLIRHRERVVPIDELLEVFWPNQRHHRPSNVRQAVHLLRDHLEPARSRHSATSFVLARAGGYELDLERVTVDADRFEAALDEGNRAYERGDLGAAIRHLTVAADLRRGEFLADEPYAEWAMDERERLRARGDRGLHLLVRAHRATGDGDAALARLRELADLDWCDLPVQRELLGLMVERGQVSEASRRLKVVRQHYRHVLGEDPEIEMPTLVSRNERARRPQKV